MRMSVSELTHLWDKVLKNLLERTEDKEVFNSYFSDSYINNVENGVMTIIVSSAVAETLGSTKFQDVINDALKEITDTDYRLVFTRKSKPSNKDGRNEKIIEDVPVPKERTYFPDAQINPNLTFNNFVVGNFNKDAAAAAKYVAQKPGRGYNPLFIFSNSGLGKTHLLHAIGNRIYENNNRANILYITANDFVEEYVKYVKGDKNGEALKDFFRDVDVLLLDDVQFLSNKTQTQEMFFYVYTKMINSNKQIVITSDRQPIDIPDLEARLVTRFTQGLLIDIKDPDEETCVEIVKEKIKSGGFDLQNVDPSVFYFYAEKFSSNVRELEGAVNRLTFYAFQSASDGKITMELAINSSQSIIGKKDAGNKLSEQKIINTVADYYNLPPSQITGKARTAQLVLARHIAMYLMRYTLDISLEKIGKAFGGKDHSTVVSGIQKVDTLLKTNEEVKQVISDLQKRLKG